jgi:two-component sensor histidine kinase
MRMSPPGRLALTTFDVSADLPFLQDGGEMGARMRAQDWARSPLGEPHAWPQSLRTPVSMMLNTMQPMFIAWGPELAFLYNDAYAPILGARHPQAMGEPFEEVWKDIWSDLSPLADRALSGQAVWQEDLLLRMHRHGYPEETYFTFTYSPLQDEAGRVAGMFCTCIETTGRVTAERRLRETAQALAASQERYRRQGERLFSLFEKAPGFVAAVEGPEHRFTLANASYRQLIGHRDVIGRTAREVLPEVESVGLFEVLDNVYRTGEPYVGRGLPVPLQRTPGGPPENRFLDFAYQPVRDEAGQITGIFVQGSDVTDRELFIDRQQTLLNELNHRVKNNLATVQSIAAQTARRSPDVPSFTTTFEGRLVALARTHDVLTQNAWTGADLAVLLEQELGAFGDRVQRSGLPARLTATQALALGLIVHELATNAAKYGALSTPTGRIEVSWQVDPAVGTFSLQWVEMDGPSVQPPTVKGFGSRLIAKLAGGDLAGEAHPQYLPDGFRLDLTAPLLAPQDGEG